MNPQSGQLIKTLLKYSLVGFLGFLFVFLLMDNLVMPLYVQQGKITRVPSVLGLPIEEARKVLTESGLDFKETEPKTDKQYPVGTVALQNPLPGTEVKFGRNVYLTVSGGELLVLVPSLRGKSIRDGTFTLERFGLSLGEITYQVSEEFPENTIIDQGIPNGTNVKKGSRIDIFVSQGKSVDRLPVPKVIMKTLSEAERVVVQQGFNVGNITYQVNLDLLPNTVIDQYPRGGELATSGTAIDLFVAKKPDSPVRLEN
ncbi:MAG: PASTA domain-containing protein [Ignavibacteriales bacterium]|nr:PASTA domain-containing protein [Ignavibacteriales bacterium]